MKKIVVGIVLSLIFIGCEQEKSAAEKQYENLMQEVLDVHDKVMPKMGKMATLIETLKNADQESSTAYTDAATHLEKAHDYMMEWMKDFSEKFPDALEDKDYTEEEYSTKIELLKEEKKKVQKMQDMVNTSIQNAEKLLNK